MPLVAKHGREVICLSILLSLCLLDSCSHSRGTHRQGGGAIVSNSLSRLERSTQPWLILPGEQVGSLKLGDPPERAFELFPRKPNIDSEFTYSKSHPCGTEYHWLDLDHPQGGYLDIRYKDGKVFQIDTADFRCETREGLKVNSTPDDVRTYYSNLRAYVLFGTASRATGDRPLVFWLSAETGIAFVFGYNPELDDRGLAGISIFNPSGQFCPEGRTTDSPGWQELPPYSLEPKPEMERRAREMLIGKLP